MCLSLKELERSLVEPHENAQLGRYAQTLVFWTVKRQSDWERTLCGSSSEKDIKVRC